MRIRACFVGVSVAALGGFAGLASAGETLVLSGTGHVEEAFPGYPGTDHPAFSGLTHLDPLSFYIEFDSDLTPISDDGVEAVYDLTGGSAYFVLDGVMMAWESVTLTIQTNAAAFGGRMLVDLRSDTWALDGWLTLRDADITSTALGAFLFDEPQDYGSIGVDTDTNPFLLPAMFGDIESSAIVPAPGAFGVLGLAAAGLMQRRRRR